MSVDLSALGNLNPIEQLDGANYADNKEKEFRLAPKGTYTLRAPESFPQAAFGRTKAGDLSVQIDPTIVAPTNEGYVVKYQKISAKTFDRGTGKASQVGDYLRACGWKGHLTDVQSVVDAIESTAGVTYQAKLDWRAYNSLRTPRMTTTWLRLSWMSSTRPMSSLPTMVTPSTTSTYRLGLSFMALVHMPQLPLLTLTKQLRLSSTSIVTD
jgi:hypothetical protein